jgi:hypothetical protein
VEWCFAHSEDSNFNDPFEHPEAAAAAVVEDAGPSLSPATTSGGDGEAVAVLLVSDCPIPEFNGLFTLAGEHQSIARFESAGGAQNLFFDRMEKRWRMSREFQPEKTNCFAWCGCKEDGSLPLGSNEWKVYFDGEWREREVTVTVAETAETHGLPPTRKSLLKGLFALTELLMQSGSDLPEREWWDSYDPDWRATAEQDDGELEIDLAFAASWTLELDSALVEYAAERARVLGKTAASALTLTELFEKQADQANVAVAAGESTPDRKALSRNVSTAPVYSARSPRQDAPVTSLSEMPEASVRARFVLLQGFNKLVKPCLPMIDLTQYAVEGTLGHGLCCVKGRLFSDTKEGLITRSLESTQDKTGEVPKPSLHVPAPGNEPMLADTVFEQLFKQLHKKHSLRLNGRKNQLWEVRMSGEGARALFTDTVDQGGWFRTSVRSLCGDVQSPPIKKADGEMSTPLFLQTPNFRHGSGSGDDATEKYVPNPACVTTPDLERFAFLGTLMGAAARYNGFMELDLPSLVWKSLLGETIGLREMRTVDAKTAARLESVLSIDDEALWAAEHASVCWSVCLVDGSISAVRGDGNENVRFSERTEFGAAAERVWLAQFKPQIEALLKGFCSSFPVAVARLQTWRELERSICGVSDVSVDTLERIARYEGSYSKGSDYIKTFWKVVRELSGPQRRQLLGFCWGRSRLPANPTEPFTIDSQGGTDDKKLPQSHTCCASHLPTAT